MSLIFVEQGYINVEDVKIFQSDMEGDEAMSNEKIAKIQEAKNLLVLAETKKAVYITTPVSVLQYLLSELDKKQTLIVNLKAAKDYWNEYHSIETERADRLNTQLQSAQDKIKSLQKQLDAKLTFINNGWEEERYVMQEDIISAQQEIERLKEQLHGTEHKYGYKDMYVKCNGDYAKLKSENATLSVQLDKARNNIGDLLDREQKLIEGLQEYANGLVDRKLAKKILKELGVTE